MSILITLNRADPDPVYMQIVKEVRRAQVSGVLERDATLPSVRELAAQLGINPNTVKQAYRELEREGVVYTRRGEGTFAAKWGQDAATRRRMAQDIARRALDEARRMGLETDELVAEIEQMDSRRPGRVAQARMEKRG